MTEHEKQTHLELRSYNITEVVPESMIDPNADTLDAFCADGFLRPVDIVTGGVSFYPELKGTLKYVGKDFCYTLDTDGRLYNITVGSYGTITPISITVDDVAYSRFSDFYFTTQTEDYTTTVTYYAVCNDGLIVIDTPPSYAEYALEGRMV